MATTPNRTKVIDYRTLLKSSTSRGPQSKAASSGWSEELMGMLTPTQLAEMFPDYYKKALPDVGGFKKATSQRYSGGKAPAGTEYAEPYKPRGKGPAGERTGTWKPRKTPIPGGRGETPFTLTDEQKKVLKDMRKEPIAINDPRVEFLLRIPKDELSKYGIKSSTNDSGIPTFSMTTKSSSMSDEAVIKEIESHGSTNLTERIAKNTLLGETGKKEFIDKSAKDGGAIGQISPDTKGSKSYGWLGVNSGFENNAGKGSALVFAQENPSFGLTATPGTREFDQQWIAAATKDPEGFHKAQLAYYQKHILEPTKKSLEKAGLPKDAVENPRIQSFISDRAIQHGQTLALDVDNKAMADAWKRSNGDVKKFMEEMNNYDRSILHKRFGKAIASGKYNERGSETRLRKRIQSALSITDEEIARSKALGPNPTKEQIDEYRNQLVEIEAKKNENLITERIGEEIKNEPKNTFSTIRGDGTPKNTTENTTAVAPIIGAETPNNGSVIPGYDPTKTYSGYGNANEEYVNKSFLPSQNMLAELGMSKAVGENPFIREGRFYEKGNAGVSDVHSKTGHHYGTHGILASDISGGGYRPEFKKLVGSKKQSRATISTFGNLMFTEKARAMLRPGELINQNRTINMRSGPMNVIQHGGHPSHVHYAPGKGLTKQDYDAFRDAVFKNPDSFVGPNGEPYGRQWVEHMHKQGLYNRNEDGTYSLNLDKYPEIKAAKEKEEAIEKAKKEAEAKVTATPATDVSAAATTTATGPKATDVKPETTAEPETTAAAPPPAETKKSETPPEAKPEQANTVSVKAAGGEVENAKSLMEVPIDKSITTGGENKVLYNVEKGKPVAAISDREDVSYNEDRNVLKVTPATRPNPKELVGNERNDMPAQEKQTAIAEQQRQQRQDAISQQPSPGHNTYDITHPATSYFGNNAALRAYYAAKFAEHGDPAAYNHHNVGSANFA